ncbi:MAG TPA: alpha/beta hydrolase [Thermoanaerobaculia bacterium]
MLAEIRMARANTSTFVLVHGAWHGGWCWRRVSDILEACGHRVFAPTLTGVGERAHLLSRDITLDTHIADVVDVFRREDIDEAVLGGHSYGGWVISGAVEVLRSQVSGLVFVDAHLPDDGQIGVDSSNGREEIEAAANRGDIARPTKTAEYFGVNERDRAWVDSMLTPQPIGPSFQPIRLTGAREAVLRRAYVRAPAFISGTFDESVLRARERGYRIYEVTGGHDVMIDAPEVLAQILLDTATETLGDRTRA